MKKQHFAGSAAAPLRLNFKFLALKITSSIRGSCSPWNQVTLL